LQNELRLEQHDVFALQAGGREQDHPSDVRGTRGNQGSNDSAFAVADEADPLRVNFLLRFQVRERRGCIAREIFGGGLIKIAGGRELAVTSHPKFNLTIALQRLYRL